MSTAERLIADTKADAADRAVLRAQIHTLRERLHVLERRVHDIELAIHHGSLRADVHADEITELKDLIDMLTKRVDSIISHIEAEIGGETK